MDLTSNCSDAIIIGQKLAVLSEIKYIISPGYFNYIFWHENLKLFKYYSCSK